MKAYKSLVAAAIAAALGTGSAFALPPGTAPTYWVFAGGGSAQANAAEWVANNLLNSVDSYTDGACGAQSGNYRIFTGTAKAAMTLAGYTTIPAGASVGFMYRFAGGTLPNGVSPFVAAPGTATGSLPTLVFPSTSYWGTASNFATTTGTGSSAVNCAASPLSSATKGLPQYALLSTSSTQNQIPAFGLSDEEPAFLNTQYNQVATFTPDSPVDGYGSWTYANPVSGAALANIQKDPIYDNLFGIVVTNQVYAGTTAFPHPKTIFSRSEIGGILSGAFKDWNQLRADDGTQMPDTPIILLDRGSGSGTKAGGSQYFLGYPGSAGAVAPGSVTFGYNYYLPVSTTDTVNCSDGASNFPVVTVGKLPNCAFTAGSYLDIAEGSNGNVIADMKTAYANNAYAIAVLGGEYPPSANQYTPSGGSAINVYSFVKIDGVGIDSGNSGDNINGNPSGTTCAASGTKYTNVINGLYDYYYQNSFNTNAANSTAVSSAGGAAFAGAAKTALQTSGVSAAANAGTLFPVSVPGLLLDPGKVHPTTQTAGIVSYTRHGNSTAVAQPYYDATNGLAASSYGCDIL